MNISPLPQPFCHPHSSAPIDIERLERINLATSQPPHRGRTTAFVVHMVGCAMVAYPNQKWLYVCDGWREVEYAKTMFMEIVAREGHFWVENNQAEGIVEVLVGPNQYAQFFFTPLTKLENRVRGLLIQDYFIDVDDDKLVEYNRSHPGVLSALPTRIEISYD